MSIMPAPAEHDMEIDERTEDAHEFGIVLHQTEPDFPLRPEDCDDEDPA